MTYPDAMKLLNEKVNTIGQVKVARLLGYSSGSIVSQVQSGTYNNGNTEVFMNKVIEVFGGLSVDCPVLGEIPLRQCAQERKKPFSLANSQRVELSKKCSKCPQNGGVK